MPLTFRALESSHPVQLGETALAFYEVTNTSDRPVSAVASYNVTPHKAGPYFSKLECFCFETRVFAPGETARLPVVFFVNPVMNDERQLDDVSAITLSYTFFESDDPVGTIQPGRPKTLSAPARPAAAANLGASPAGELAYKSGETRIEREEG
jgi:cytochrome c oxidase assembly protein Cox11